MTGPRRFFQLHLSTALVLMMLSAGLFGLNLVPRKTLNANFVYCYRGWPFAVELTFQSIPGMKIEEEPEELKQFEPSPKLMKMVREVMSINKYWHGRFVGNIFVALGILTLTAVLLEWRLRRRAE